MRLFDHFINGYRAHPLAVSSADKLTNLSPRATWFTRYTLTRLLHESDHLDIDGNNLDGGQFSGCLLVCLLNLTYQNTFCGMSQNTLGNGVPYPYTQEHLLYHSFWCDVKLHTHALILWVYEKKWASTQMCLSIMRSQQWRASHRIYKWKTKHHRACWRHSSARAYFWQIIVAIWRKWSWLSLRQAMADNA